MFPESPASTVLALRQSASHGAASLELPPPPALSLLGFLVFEEADIRLSGAQRWFRLHLDRTQNDTRIRAVLLIFYYFVYDTF